MLLLKEKRDLLPQIGLLKNSTLDVLERGLTVTSIGNKFIIRQEIYDEDKAIFILLSMHMGT
jgi:hypothetical protein